MRRSERVNKKYQAKISGVEDLDGTSSYYIGSDNPIPQSIIDELNRTDISINRLELACKLNGFIFEAIEYED